MDRDDLEMRRVAAQPNAAQVVHCHPVRDFAAGEENRHAVRQAHPALESNSTVAAALLSAEPDPAGAKVGAAFGNWAVLVYLGEKTRLVYAGFRERVRRYLRATKCGRIRVANFKPAV